MRAHHILIAIVVLAGCGTPKGAPQPHVASVAVLGGATVDQLDVAVSALRSDRGTIRCYLYDDGDGFPESKAHVVGKAIALPGGGRATCEFTGVRRDHDFAVVILHDENNDDVFQKNFLGLPLEGYGFSNDAAPGLSAPSFGECRFHYAGDHQTIAIKMRY